MIFLSVVLTMSKWALVCASPLPGFPFKKIHPSLITDAYTVSQWNTAILIQALRWKHNKNATLGQ